MKRKCAYCTETTNKSLSDFWEVKWEAVSFNGRKAVCACPKHTKILELDMNNSLNRNCVEVQVSSQIQDSKNEVNKSE